MNNFLFRQIILLCWILSIGLILCAETLTTAPIKIEQQNAPTPWTHLDFHNKPENFQFAIMADRNGKERSGVFEDAINKLNLLQPEFVICVGDLIPGYSKDAQRINSQWDVFQSVIKNLEMPFFYVPGNHDLTNDMQRRIWKERIGKSYYHFLYHDVLFLCVCTEEPQEWQISQPQIKYFREVLSKNRDVRWTFVFMHKPMWNNKKAKGWQDMEKLLQDRPHTVFAGHNHRYNKFERNGNEYIIIATTGGGSSMRGPLYGEFDHVVWVTMTEEKPRIANLMLNGIADTNIRTAEMVALIEPVQKGRIIQIEPILIEGALPERVKTDIKFHNPTRLPMSIKGSLKSTSRLHIQPAGINLTLPPDATDTINATINIVRPENLAIEDLPPILFKWAVSYEEQQFAGLQPTGETQIGIDRKFVCPKRTEPIAVDGNLSDWASLPHTCTAPMQINLEPGAWKGAEDSSFRFGAAWDDEYLYIAVEVIDDELFSNPEAPPWEQDAVEIRIDARPARQRHHGRGKNEFTNFLLFAMTPATDKTPSFCYNNEELPSGCRYSCKRTATGFAAEVAVPRAWLDAKQKQAWEAFRLNIFVDDFDSATDPGSQICWRPDWRSQESWAGSGSFWRDGEK
ncbi:MAG TPA: sugar-binding protein [Candidatus Sumerlaeota bacterium]|nr:sugar-binding protein [Candidatus Sumerlaeota bacterium]HON50739.1 sugar-binding protein [Candidatus Sumerlaeota bacterium]HOR65143.1 sugar-binding protein [Candidatus Sumerlaeota bacterium]HPL75285.1 sugar-binding protein [Candidatus Sumerlaeota bacterium]HRU53954.1 sugar-binding protein [Candidatus Sumerlaeia bacterium]